MWNHANDSNNEEKIIYRELSYRFTGVLFKVHKELGRFAREKQYGDYLEKELTQANIKYEREKNLPIQGVDNQRTNIVDFSIDDKVLVDLKAKPFISKDDYYQMQRYLKSSGYKLGLLVNFRSRYLKPLRVINYS